MEGLLQPTHLFFILLIVLIIFGPGKLPELGRSLGKGIREFKGAISDVKGESKDTDKKSS
jgi:sec-independent protein translocase protein TatA